MLLYHSEGFSNQNQSLQFLYIKCTRLHSVQEILRLRIFIFCIKFGLTSLIYSVLHLAPVGFSTMARDLRVSKPPALARPTLDNPTRHPLLFDLCNTVPAPKIPTALKINLLFQGGSRMRSRPSALGIGGSLAQLTPLLRGRHRIGWISCMASARKLRS
jgi:hypothetical protein